MRSSGGAHFIALDHIRALAAFMVVAWHFTHAASGYPVPFEYVPMLFPFSVLDEGHTGVALFMTLSGYLFAKLLNGKSISYRAFLWNRALRLLPLLIVVIGLVGAKKFVRGEDLSEYVRDLAEGLVLPTLPNGGWSITVEAHYYVFLPVFLWMLRISRLLPLVLIVAAVVLRFVIHSSAGEVQTLAYWTLVGRIDQFAMGMLVYQFRDLITSRHLLASTIVVTFLATYWLFDWHGGFYLSPSYPSPEMFWVLIPTLEATAYAMAIAWYDTSFAPSNRGMSKFIARIGAYSYSIYLLHFFVVFLAARFVHENVMDISNFYVACAWSMLFFLAMMLPGHLSYQYIELPFLKLRRPYISSSEQTRVGVQPAPLPPTTQS